MHYDMKQSGARIRFFRKQNRCTQEELAKLLSMDRSFLSGIESGKKGCSVDLFILSDAYFLFSSASLMLIRCLCCLPAHFHSHRGGFFLWSWSGFICLYSLPSSSIYLLMNFCHPLPRAGNGCGDTFHQPFSLSKSSGWFFVMLI